MLDRLRTALSARMVLLLSLVLFWINFLTTGRWAQVPGSLHGPKEPWFLAALVLCTIAAVWPGRGADRVSLGRAPAIFAALATSGLIVCFFTFWFPLSTWSQIPLLDNWPARFQSTVDGISLMARGAVVGWQWDFLGGYHSSSDLTVTLSAVAWPWMWLFGDAPGFHLTQLLLFVALPAIVYWDLRLDARDDVAAAGAGFAALTSANFSFFFLRSGDTNSFAGVIAAALVLTGSHAAARGRRWGAALMVAAMALVIYCHAGFFVYTSMMLGVEAMCYRDWARLKRAAVAIAAGAIGGLPLTWESWRYAAYFNANNVLFDPSAPWPWLQMARKLYYNVELLALPPRWFNDFSTLPLVAAPIVLFVAWRDRGRSRFYAWAALACVVLLRFNLPQLGYAFLRPVHLLALFIGPVIAAFVLRWAGTRARAGSFAAVAALYLQVWLQPVPHAASARAAVGPVLDAIAAADGAIVLVENHYHRDMIVDESRTTPPTPFLGNFEALIPPATGKRLYAGVWDGWQWSPYRGQMLANGSWQGRAIDDVARDEFVAELRRWGIHHLFVWSEPSIRYLAADARLREIGTFDRWRQFVLTDADTRDAAVAHGSATITSRDPLGARIRLVGVTRGDRVVVRTNYHPAWTARAGGSGIALANDAGQLAFDVPADGDGEVELIYPRRPWLLFTAFAAVFAAAVINVRQIPPRR